MRFKIIFLLFVSAAASAMMNQNVADADHAAEQHVNPTVDQLAFIVTEKTECTITDDKISLLFESGQNQLLVDYSAFDKQSVINGLFAAVQNFDPSIVYTNAYPEAIPGYWSDSEPLPDDLVLYSFVSESEPDKRLDFSISYGENDDRNFFYYMLSHAPKEILAQE